jgi:glycosyltransferase involved in cell wall biosynthesis
LKVSVVIPTVGRPELARAIASVQSQSAPVQEIIVAADTVDEFSVPNDERISVLRVGPGGGGNAARQAGIQRASSDVIALLDDDDEWHPRKIELMRSVIGNPAGDWVATSRIVMKRADGTELVQPSFPIDSGEDLRDYMFSKRGPRSSHGFVQASTLMFPRRLALELPFDASLRFHQDIGWLTMVARARPQLTVFQSWEPLASYFATEGSVSKKIAPEGSIEWAARNLDDRPRLLGDFILTQSLGFARRSGSVRSMIRTLAAGMRIGRPSAAAIVYAVGATVKYSIGRRNA